MLDLVQQVPAVHVLHPHFIALVIIFLNLKLKSIPVGKQECKSVVCQWKVIFHSYFTYSKVTLIFAEHSHRRFLLTTGKGDSGAYALLVRLQATAQAAPLKESILIDNETGPVLSRSQSLSRCAISHGPTLGYL